MTPTALKLAGVLENYRGQLLIALLTPLGATLANPPQPWLFELQTHGQAWVAAGGGR